MHDDGRMTETSRSLFVVGGIIAAISGLFGALLLAALLLSEPDTGANIGAGLLFIAAAPLGVVAVGILTAGLITHLLSRRR